MPSLHKQAAAFLEEFEKLGVPPVREAESLEEARENFASLGNVVGAGPEVGSVRDLTIPLDGVDLEGRFYTPPGEDPAGLIVFFFGGGWVVGGPYAFDAMHRKLVSASNCSLLSVGYRLAPEHPFPTAVDDCDSATQWAIENLSDGLPIVLAGESAGANLAAVTTRRHRDRGDSAVAFQLLAEPVTDHQLDRPSYYDHQDLPLLVEREDMVWFWDQYLPDVTARDDPDASPLRAASLAGLPPARVIVAEFDPLRDEGRAYAEALEAAGVPVELEYLDDQVHGFFALVNIMESADAAVENAGTAIRRALTSRT